MENDGSAAVENQLYKAQIAALEQLVEVYEKSVLKTTDELYGEIARRKRVEEELKEKDRFVESIIQVPAVAIIVINPEHKVIYWNKACEDLTGIKAENILGTKEQWKAFYDHPRPCIADIIIDNKFDEMTNLYPVFTRSMLIPDGIRAEGWYPNLGGKNRYIVFDAAPIHDDHGKISAVIETLQDITERKRAEEALRKSEEKYSHFFSTSRDCVFITSKDGRWIDLNDAAVELFDYASREELMQVNISELYANREERSKHISAIAACGYTKEYPADLLRKDGTVIHTLITTAARYDNRGNVIGFQGTIRDITRRKKAEEEIFRLNEKLEQQVEERTCQLLAAQQQLIRKEKLSVLGQLAGVVGHEIRNPLGVMSNAVYFLKTVLTDADDMVKEYLDIIKQEIDNSQRIITDLLDFARTKTPQIVPVAANVLVTQALGKCIIPENVDVQTDIPKTLPKINADPFQMGQVLQNLVANAAQAMPKGGALTISARRGSGVRGQGSGMEGFDADPRSPASDPCFIEISVKDTGCGISPENMGKLFQPLFTTKTKGIGLGLVVCKNLVEANSGRIEVKSRLGEGTTFTVIVPFEKREE